MKDATNKNWITKTIQYNDLTMICTDSEEEICNEKCDKNVKLQKQ